MRCGPPLISHVRAHMVDILGLVNFGLVGLLYVWYLGLAAKWTLKLGVSRKLRWIFFGLVLAITFLNILLTGAIGRPTSAALGAVAHLLFGGWFFGKFAVRPGGEAPGFGGGVKMTAVAMALLLVTIGALLGGSLFIIASLGLR